MNRARTLSESDDDESARCFVGSIHDRSAPAVAAGHGDRGIAGPRRAAGARRPRACGRAARICASRHGAGPSERATEAQHAKGKLTARERIELLLDEGSFSEVEQLRRHRATGFGLEAKKPYTDGVITGWGTVDGPDGLRLRARLPDLRRRAGRGPRHEDPQDHGHGHLGRCAAGLAERRRGRPYPGGRLRARRLRRHLPAQHPGLRASSRRSA